MQLMWSLNDTGYILLHGQEKRNVMYLTEKKGKTFGETETEPSRMTYEFLSQFYTFSLQRCRT